MGEIIFWALIRIILTIPLLWLLRTHIDFQLWWIVSAFAIYAIIIHPIILQNRKFTEQNKDVLESTLCASCKHFDKSAVLCMKYDKHPTISYLPCDGLDWEPSGLANDNSEIFNDQ